MKVLLTLIILLSFHPLNISFAGDCDTKTSAGTPTVSGNYIYSPGHTCTKDPDLIYDTINSHETIERDGSANLFVIGNNGPFTWSVSDQGFWLDANYTIKTLENNGLTATLYADGTACGAATITVTGCNGPPPETGYVRCSYGNWGNCIVLCDGTGDGICWWGGPGMCEKIEGNRKYWTAVRDNRYGWFQSCCDQVEEGCDLGTCQFGANAVDVCSTSVCDVTNISEAYWECT